MMKHVLWFVLLLCMGLLARAGEPEDEDAPPRGWTAPYIGAGHGDWDLSVSAFFHEDGIDLRNLQWRADADLGRGLRAHTVVRSNSDRHDSIGDFSPRFDEGYLEAFRFHHTAAGVFSGSLRVGAMRYLRFPVPDAIATFDQVPGIEDLQGRHPTGWSGGLLTLDYAWRHGLNAHLTTYQPGFSRDGDTEVLEGYLGLRKDFDAFHFEARGGRLAARTRQLDTGKTGFNTFLGLRAGDYLVGALYEKLDDTPGYTGIMVQFAPTDVTRALGRVAFDYDRSPRGISTQLTLFDGRFGLRRREPADAELVGEVRAERIRTYWQNGHVRNYYEHRLSSWGETSGKGVIAVMDPESWYLQAEALVSPHGFEDLKAWEKDRQGPAQLARYVTYRFYRPYRKHWAAETGE